MEAEKIKKGQKFEGLDDEQKQVGSPVFWCYESATG
jgi:hypothetical protein